MTEQPTVEIRYLEETLAWLESSLEYARARGQTGLEELLEAVRTEVEFEAAYPGASRFARRLLPERAVNDSRTHFASQMGGANLCQSDSSPACESGDDG